MALALAVISCLASGYFLVAVAWPRRAPGSDRLLRASLSVGYGIGAWSLVFFLGRVSGQHHWLAIDVCVMVLLAAAFFLRRAKSIPRPRPAPHQACAKPPTRIDRVLAIGFGLALAAALYSCVLRSIVHPHGEGWDAFAIWNLHARFLVRSDDWREGLSALIPWSHPDYPFLLPAAVAHFWSALGKESTLVPAAVGVAFSFATIGLLFSSLAILRGPASAMVGGLALLATPFFVEQGTSQYADVPLSFFFLAAMALLHLYAAESSDGSPAQSGFLWLAGLGAGFAVWTKNEGMLYLCATLGAWMLVFGFSPRGREVPAVRSTARDTRNRRRSGRAAVVFLAGAAPFLILVLWCKHSVAFSNEFFSHPSAMLQKILDPARYGVIAQWYAKDFLRFGEWWLVPGTLVLTGFYCFLRSKRTIPNRRDAIAPSLWTLLLTLIGYFAIYVITPYDLRWHLRFSLNRLFLQVWPSTIFVVLLALPFGLVQKSQNEPDSLKRNAFPGRNSDTTP
jgi:Dolichyl-phosphate-mannose-protein mannosyltransferase